MRAPARGAIATRRDPLRKSRASSSLKGRRCRSRRYDGEAWMRRAANPTGIKRALRARQRDGAARQRRRAPVRRETARRCERASPELIASTNAYERSSASSSVASRKPRPRTESGLAISRCEARNRSQQRRCPRLHATRYDRRRQHRKKKRQSRSLLHLSVLQVDHRAGQAVRRRRPAASGSSRRQMRRNRHYSTIPG